MRKYVLVLPYGAFDNYMYRDLIDCKFVDTYLLNKPMDNKVINIVKRIHRSCVLNGIVNLPYKGIWSRSINHLLSKDTCLIFDTGALSMLSLKFLEKIRNSSNRPKMVAIIVDSMHAHSSHMKIAKPIIKDFEWDVVLSFDYEDCKEFGFKYVGQTLYSKITDVEPSDNISDIFFVGRNKNNRNDIVRKLYQYFCQNDVRCNFNLGDTKISNILGRTTKYPGLNEFYHNLPYGQVLADVLASNCILEVVQQGQNAQTARYYEAVCYNKKLLTNNLNVKKMPFYDERYIKTFKSVDDIDLNWVKDKSVVNYEYNNEFSPIKILDKLEKLK